MGKIMSLEKNRIFETCPQRGIPRKREAKKI
jgi:hypothetical protein